MLIGAGVAAALAGGAAAAGAAERSGAKPGRSSTLSEYLNTVRVLHGQAMQRSKKLEDTVRPGIEQRLRGEYPNAPMFAQGAAERERSDYNPSRSALLEITRDPADDELTRFLKAEYERDVRDRLGARGLLGQGSGEALESDAMRRFYMDVRDRADSRRASALQNTNALDTFLGSRDQARVGERRTTEGDYSRQLGAEQQIANSLLGPMAQAAAMEQGREMAAFDAFMNSPTPYEAGINSAVGTFGTMYGAGGGMGGGGGGGSQIPHGNVTYGGGSNVPFSSAATGYGGPGVYDPGRYSLSTPGYAGTEYGMTPWGAPVYNLNGDPYGGGGPMSKTGNYRFMRG